MEAPAAPAHPGEVGPTSVPPRRESLTPARPGAVASLLSDSLIFLLFLAVPLAASPLSWDQFTTVKWYVLEVLAALWFPVELILVGKNAWPTFLKRKTLVCALLAAMVLAGNLRGGFALLMQPLLERLTFVMLALCFFWYFARTAGRTTLLVAGTALATVGVNAVGLAQVFGLRPLSALTAGDQHSAFFGNVNMTAQFLGFAVLILLTARFRAGSSRHSLASLMSAFRWSLIAASLLYLFFLSCRSVALALFCAGVVHFGARRISLRLASTLLGALALASVLLQVGPAKLLTEELRVNKWVSPEQRLTVWRGTLGMIRDHPLGVGSGNFGEAFVPYRSVVGSTPSETWVFLHPHNEYLRVLAEEGALVFLLGAAFLFSLVSELRHRDKNDWCAGTSEWLAPVATFLALESFFQFPLALAFGSLVAAALLGVALARVEGAGAKQGAASPEERGVGPGRLTRVAVGIATSLGVLLGVWRVGGSEYLFVNRSEEVWFQDRACSLNPRNRPACVMSAWLHARVGDSQGARERLLRVLAHAPYYPPAIKLLGQEALARGDRRDGCLCLWIYDELFRRESSVHDRVRRECEPKWIEAFAARVKMPHYRRFPWDLPSRP